MTAHLFSFYVPSLSESDATVAIGGEEHRHLSRVLRMSPGETVRLTNGCGLSVLGDIETIGGARTVARVTQIEGRQPSPRRLVLALALLQRAHFESAIAQCVEVGVTEFLPVLAEKRHVRAWSHPMHSRCERVAIAAMKQSGRAWLPPVREALTVDALARAARDFALAVVGDADGAPAPDAAGGDTLLVIGPEGGFTDAERNALEAAGVVRVSVSRFRLRAETAAAVLAAALGRGV